MNYFYPRSDAPTQAAATDAPGLRAEDAIEGGDAAAPAAAPGSIDAPAAPAEPLDLEEQLATADRITIDSTEVTGAINPVGARIDDIELKDHRQSIDEDNNNPVVECLPEHTSLQGPRELHICLLRQRNSPYEYPDSREL